MENQAHMEVNLDEGQPKKRGQIPWEPVEVSKRPTYKDPVKITLFVSEGKGSLMEGVEESPAPESFDWRLRRKLLSRKERKELERFTGIKCSGKDEEPLRVFDEEDGPAKLTNKEMRKRKKRENMDPAEAMEETINEWQKNHPGFRALMKPKEWKNSPAILRLRQALGLPLFSPEDAANARERAMIEAAKRATRDFPVCHPLCLFGVSPSARALADAEADLRAKMGVAGREVCRELAAKRCDLRQRSQATVVEESVAIERDRRSKKKKKKRKRRGSRRSRGGSRREEDDSDEDSDESRGGRSSRSSRRSKRRGRKGSPDRRRDSDEDSGESPARGARRKDAAKRGRRHEEDRSRGSKSGGRKASRTSLGSASSGRSGRSDRSRSPGRRRRERRRERERERVRERERKRPRCAPDDIRRSSSPYHQKCTEPGPGTGGRVLRRHKSSKH